MFEKDRAEQIVAFFAMQEPDKKINIMKVIKLIYLADRKNIEKYGDPITDDDYFSMPNGPVCSKTLDMLNAVPPTLAQNTNILDRKFLGNRFENIIPLKVLSIERDDLDELSESDIEILEEIWQEFGKMDGFALSEWTHQPENVPEWQDPDGGSKPISLKTIMANVGIENVDEHYAEWESLQSVIKELHSSPN